MEEQTIPKIKIVFKPKSDNEDYEAKQQTTDTSSESKLKIKIKTRQTQDETSGTRNIVKLKLPNQVNNHTFDEIDAEPEEVGSPLSKKQKTDKRVVIVLCNKLIFRISNRGCRK